MPLPPFVLRLSSPWRSEKVHYCTSYFVSIYPSIWVFHDVFAYPFLKFHCFFGYMDCFSSSFQYPFADLNYLLGIFVYKTELEAFAIFEFWVFVLFICLDLLRSYSLRIYFVYGKTLHSSFYAQISGQFFLWDLF